VSEALEAWVSSDELPPEAHQVNLTLLSSFKTLFETLLDLSVDPHPEVAGMAATVVDYIVALLLSSAFNRVAGTSLKALNLPKLGSRFSHVPPPLDLPRTPTTPSRSEPPSTPTGRDSLKRNSSVAGALRSLASFAGFTATEAPEPVVAPADPVTRTDLDVAQSGASFYKSPYPNASYERIVPEASIGRNGANSNSPVAAVDVIEALVEEDMERLRHRRLRGTQAGGDADGKLANNGLPRPSDLGLGMVATEVKDDVMPLRSDFFDWAVEYFREPQMKAPDSEEPGSKSYNQQAWRHQRNERQTEQSRENEEYAAHSRWDGDAGTLHNDACPLQLAFHAHDSILAVTDDEDKICIWDWQARTKINKFSNQNIAGSSISSVHFINESASSLILTASSELHAADADADAGVYKGLFH
jgi:regulator-associated protein of mTOR